MALVGVALLASGGCGAPSADEPAEPSGSASSTASPPSATSSPGEPTGPATEPSTEPAVEIPSVPAADPVRRDTRFVVGSFNVLGHRHTVPSGNRPRFADSRVRMVGAVSLLRDTDVSVAGLQEFHRVQLWAFQDIAPEYAVWPGLELGGGIVQNSIVWRRSEWRKVAGDVVDIPYFGGTPHPMPFVLLEHRRTGRQVWFANFHNPANVRGPAEQWRREARRTQAALTNRLLETGREVIVTGDMNEKWTYACRVGRRAPLRSADGSGWRDGGCTPPADGWIDWILGTPGIRFDAHVVDRTPVGSTSDHPLIRARVSIAGDDGNR